MTATPDATIRIVEVGPRDGLQNEAGFVPTPVKIAFVDALSAAGFDEIEVSSFVDPRRIPQLADAEEVFRGITRRRGVRYTALVPNERGLARALEVGVDGIAVFTAASETFNQRNVNATIAESIERFRPVLAKATVPVRGYVSTAFRCPYEGRVAPGVVADIAERLYQMGCGEISIGDTIGQAEPDEIRALLEVLLPRVPVTAVALHLHDTFGRALDNAHAAADLGVTVFDGSAGGLGGCPFAPGAPGNLATESLIRAFAGRTHVELAPVEAASALIRPYLRAKSA